MPAEYKRLALPDTTPIENIIAAVMGSWAQVYMSRGSSSPLLYFRIQAGSNKETSPYSPRHMGILNFPEAEDSCKEIWGISSFSEDEEILLTPIEMVCFSASAGMLLAAELAAVKVFPAYRRLERLTYGINHQESVDLCCVASLVVEDDSPRVEVLPYVWARIWEVQDWASSQFMGVPVTDTFKVYLPE